MKATPEFIAFIQSRIGPGRWKSARRLSLGAGLSQNTLALIMHGGGCEPNTVRALAKALDVPPEDLYVLLGWLPERETAPPICAASPEEEEMLQVFRRIAPDGQRMLLGAARGALQAPGPLAME